MTDVWISWEDTQDPQACRTNPNIYESFSRDPVILIQLITNYIYVIKSNIFYKNSEGSDAISMG